MARERSGVFLDCVLDGALLAIWFFEFTQRHLTNAHYLRIVGLQERPSVLPRVVPARSHPLAIDQLVHALVSHFRGAF